jgi:hypothetical protein
MASNTSGKLLVLDKSNRQAGSSPFTLIYALMTDRMPGAEGSLVTYGSKPAF